MVREGIPTGNPSPVLPLVDRTPRELVSGAAADGTEVVADLATLVSPSSGLGTTVEANIPPASLDLSLPAPRWSLARPRGSSDSVPVGRGTTRGLGLVGRGVCACPPGSFPRSLPEMCLLPGLLEERPRPGPPAVLEQGTLSIRGLGRGSYGCVTPRCVPLLEVAPYQGPVGRGLLLAKFDQQRQIDVGAAGSNPRNDRFRHQHYQRSESSQFSRMPSPLPAAQVEGQVHYHLFPRDSRDSSPTPSVVEAEVDSESAASDFPDETSEVSVDDLHLLSLALEDLLAISDIRSVMLYFRRQLRLLLVDVSSDQASSTIEENERDVAADL